MPRRDDGVKKHEVVVGTERIGRVSGVRSANRLGRVTLVKNGTSCGERWVTDDALLEPLKGQASGCHIIHLQACRRGNSDIAVPADEIVHGGLLSFIDSLDRVEWSQVAFGDCRGSTVGKSPGDDGLFLGYGGIH